MLQIYFFTEDMLPNKYDHIIHGIDAKILLNEKNKARLTRSVAEYKIVWYSPQRGRWPQYTLIISKISFYATTTSHEHNTHKKFNKTQIYFGKFWQLSSVKVAATGFIFRVFLNRVQDTSYA